MTQLQLDLISDYFNEGHGTDIRDVENLFDDKGNKQVIVLSESVSSEKHFINFLKDNGITIEEFDKEYNISSWDYSESYVYCEQCGGLIYISDYETINNGYIKDINHYFYCNSCADYDEIIDGFINDYAHCVNGGNKDEVIKTLKDKGFNLEKEYDFQMGDALKPYDVVKQYKDKDYIWVLTGAYVFGTSAELWIRNKQSEVE